MAHLVVSPVVSDFGTLPGAEVELSVFLVVTRVDELHLVLGALRVLDGDFELFSDVVGRDLK